MVTIPEEVWRAKNSENEIVHYGTPRHSGRYPWGSGDQPHQSAASFQSMVDELKKNGITKEVDIARAMGFESTSDYRDTRTLLRNERVQDEIHMARKLKAKGMSNGAIAKRMGLSGESQVRNLLKDSQEVKTRVIDNVTNTLRKAVDEKDFIDVGSGVEYQLGITPTRLRAVLRNLKNEGYRVHPVPLPQLGTGKNTNMKVLVKPGVEWGEAMRNRHNIKQITEYSNDGGLTSLGILPPKSISSKRVGIRYDKDGGGQADGVIYVRRNVPDVSLGSNRYAQVRIAVDGTHYLKGMAMYKDDLPPGIDIQFNTNKDDTGNKLDAMKEMKRTKEGDIDWDNPFGATISRQIGTGIDTTTGKPKELTSVMNLVNEEGKWAEWSRNLSSQVLSKQRPALAKEQLDIAYQRKKSELERILALNNPNVKRKLLEAFSDGADASAVHLKAAALPRQKTQVILPINTLKHTEVFAPGFNDGELVSLIRFPHGGTFEIPELTVNNRNPEGRNLIGVDGKDAIGIHHKVAERLSGADFDGDTVLVIPNNSRKVLSTPPLKGLENFDPKREYPPYEGMPKMAASGPNSKGFQMGLISNLITDMTIRKANSDELARAVKHSMVVIDAEKHNLDYRRSAIDNRIAELVKSYQPSSAAGGGAATLISRARSEIRIPERKPRPARDGGPIDPKTGKKVYVETGKTWPDGKGKEHLVKTTSTKLAETDDAHTLSSGTVIENDYANHSNRLKDLANQGRKAMVAIKSRPYSPTARETFKNEVATLNAKLEEAIKNAPRERQAQVIANATVRMKVLDNPALRDKENSAEYRRVKMQALAAARIRTQAMKKKFDITDAEWAAIQSGAVTSSKLDSILNYANLDRIKELATPRERFKMSTNDLARGKSLLNKGYTWAEIAEALGVSVSTAQEALGSSRQEGGD